ncbi:hypothetical protein RBU61_08350 [Tissierella sp. MB52-C2]|uniref:hypothetical protein n=1 Tax=Tissierella sp. MB52-C2 TaxID=3070999 RepID=UPI00280B4D78|nr:hypothetical protein [Tissierella sp. MB52-C2]WMM26675.1 hypothetical protein RBU61_08350 [Tissierella sp. MB52-C2]
MTKRKYQNKKKGASKVENAMKYDLNLIISLIAVVFTSLTYIKDNTQPQMFFSYGTYGINETLIEAKPYPAKNTIKFQELLELSKSMGIGSKAMIGGKIVEFTRPGSELMFAIENKGKVVAKNPTIVFQFNGVFVTQELERQLENLFPVVKKRDHVHGLGFYRTYQWISTDTERLYPNIPINFYEISFSECEVEEGAYLMVIIAADNAETKSYKLDIEVDDFY